MTVVYTTAERFTSEFVGSLRSSGSAAERFKARYRNVGALLIDDIQFLENKPHTEDEFFHTFNELYAAGSQIVLSSDRPPEAMERLTERLRDRFAWGLTVQVSQPDLADPRRPPPPARRRARDQRSRCRRPQPDRRSRSPPTCAGSRAP